MQQTNQVFVVISGSSLVDWKIMGFCENEKDARSICALNNAVKNRFAGRWHYALAYKLECATPLNDITVRYSVFVEESHGNATFNIRRIGTEPYPPGTEPEYMRLGNNSAYVAVYQPITASEDVVLDIAKEVWFQKVNEEFEIRKENMGALYETDTRD